MRTTTVNVKPTHLVTLTTRCVAHAVTVLAVFPIHYATSTASISPTAVNRSPTVTCLVYVRDD